MSDHCLMSTQQFHGENNEVRYNIDVEEFSIGTNGECFSSYCEPMHITLHGTLESDSLLGQKY